MHIPTTALLAISFYILGRPSTVHAHPAHPAQPAHDRFGAEDYFIICHHRVYSKNEIYKLANHYCVTIKENPDLRNRPFGQAGYRSKYPTGTIGDEKKKLLNHDSHIVPIRLEGLFHFELYPNQRRMKNMFGREVRMQPERDRLALSKDCLILGIFYDYDHPYQRSKPYISWCPIIDKSTNLEIITPISQ